MSKIVHEFKAGESKFRIVSDEKVSGLQDRLVVEQARIDEMGGEGWMYVGGVSRAFVDPGELIGAKQEGLLVYVLLRELAHQAEKNHELIELLKRRGDL